MNNKEYIKKVFMKKERDMGNSKNDVNLIKLRSVSNEIELSMIKGILNDNIEVIY